MQNGGFVNKIQGVRLSVAKIHRHVFENPGCKEMAKTYLNFTEKQLKQFEKNFYIVADKYVFGAKKEGMKI